MRRITVYIPCKICRDDAAFIHKVKRATPKGIFLRCKHDIRIAFRVYSKRG